MKRYLISLYLLLLFMVLAVFSESYYSINAPGVIKSNHKYSVVVTLHEAAGPSSIRVSIDGPSFQEFQDVNLEPFESKLLHFMPKRITSDDYILIAEGLSGLSFKNKSRLYGDVSSDQKIFIQTDKAIYKPEDVVKFRIVILDEHTKPLNTKEPVRVDILDNVNNRVKQFQNVSLTTGVYTDKFKLSKYPVLGTWTIKVDLGGSYEFSRSKYIQINKYVLPKFIVYLKTPSDIILQDGYIKVVIFGKYTFYKHVEGNATVELWHEKYKLQTKYIDIEHLGFVEFDIKNETTIKNAERLKVKAKLSEMTTGRTESNYQYINLHSQRYNLQIPDNEIEFENNIPYKLKVLAKHWTGAAVLDHKTPITMEHGNKTYESYLDAKGVAVFEFEHDANDDHQFQFKDSKVTLPNIYTNENLMLNQREYYCRLRLLDDKLKLGKPVLIEVSSIKSIPYLAYIIMGHASLIHMNHIKLPPNQKSYIINITATIEMIPDSFVYVYYVHKDNLRYEEIHLNFPQEFENQITLSAPKQVKPGEEVTISINAQPNSYVSILAVDLGVYILDKTYDLNRDEIFNDLVSVRSFSPISATVYPGIISGLVTLTNAHYKYKSLHDDSQSKSFEPTAIKYREHFPETWIFDNFVINETNTKLTLPIPETITTWRITAFSNNEVTGFGIVNGPTDITTMQSFFITLTLPYSVKRGEIVKIPITIYNYSNQTQDTEVVLHNNDQEFYFMESEIKGVMKSNESQHKIEHISVPKDKAKTVNFLIYPRKAGEVSLKATASRSLYTDAVLQKLKVEPEGVPEQNNQAQYLSIPEGEKISSSFSIKMAEDSVPDSDYITFSVGGHYLVPTVENFDDLIQMPTGCGEQNMVNFAPSILILQYLKANGKFSKKKRLVESLLSSIEVGYQQQLSFRYENGGYSVFGISTDEEPSTWLTAYVVRYFIKASEFISIEATVIESALEYLVGEQKSTGEFPYTGYLLKPNHQNKYGLTAFVLLAFLESPKYAKQYEGTIQNGLEFLKSNLNNTNDIYDLSLIAIAAKRAKYENSDIVINQLKSHAKENNGLKWWSENDQSLINDIEVTACAAISLLDTAGDHTSILKWLIEQRNTKGGFKSSYDTVVGMEALVKFSEKYNNVENINLKISYSAKDEKGVEITTDEFHVDSNNILDFQKHELPKNTRQVTFEIEGNGATLVQLNHQYNIANDQDFRHFNIQPKAVFKNAEELNLEVCFTYQMDSESLNETTNMVIMEANLPSGFRSDVERKNEPLNNNQIVQLIETKNSDSTIILYLEKLEANVSHCLEILAYKVIDILMPKPAAILMYDYYNLTRSNTAFYNL